MKLKIISIKDRNGNEKTDFLKEIKLYHPSMSGEWIYKFSARNCGSFCLVWDDDSNKMLRTSRVINIVELDSELIVETENSVYEFEILKLRK